MMNIDYSQFLHAAEDGRIWWRLADAIKLGAGYLPVCDDERNLVPVLRAPNNRVRVHERTLIGATHDNRLLAVPLRTLERDDGRFVEARDFLGWLSQYITQTQAEIPFPCDITCLVRDATGAPVEHSTSPPDFESLTAALEEWFDRPLADLPDAQRRRVERDFFPMPWDVLTPDQRRSVAQQWDYQHDPATEEQRRLWWEFFVRKGGIEKEIEEWKAVSAPTATDLEKKETRLAEWRRELGVMDKQQQMHEIGATEKYSSRNIYAPDEQIIPYASKGSLTLTDLIVVTNGAIRPGRFGHGERFMVTEQEIAIPPLSEFDLSTVFPSNIKEMTEDIEAWRLKLPCTPQELVNWAQATGNLQILREAFVEAVGIPKKPGETPAERKARLGAWREEEIRLRSKRGADLRVAEREGVSRQRVGQILKGK